MIIIGRNPVIESLKFNPGSIEKILLLNAPSDKKVKDIIKTAARLGIEIEHKPKAEFEKLFDRKDKSEGISQGIAALVKDFEYTEFTSLLNDLNEKKDFLLIILDEIQDPHNLGAIIRTAAAANADAVIISEKNSASVNHTVVKASSGAVNYIKVVQSNNIYRAITSLKNVDTRIIGTSLNAKQTHFDCNYSGRIALMFGNEGEGLRKNLLKLCDVTVIIPIDSKVESLNVSVAAGVILFEALRQRKKITA